MNDLDRNRNQRVVKIFEESKLNQREFAELIGVSQQLVSAVINYKKKANETILFAIIDTIKTIDPLWLFTGKGEYKNCSVPPVGMPIPLKYHVNTIVQEQFEDFTNTISNRLSNIEASIKEMNAKNILRRIDQDNAKLFSEKAEKSNKLGS